MFHCSTTKFFVSKCVTCFLVDWQTYFVWKAKASKLCLCVFLGLKSKLFSQIVIHYEANRLQLRFQAIHSKSKHFSDLENNTFKVTCCQGPCTVYVGDFCMRTAAFIWACSHDSRYLCGFNAAVSLSQCRWVVLRSAGVWWSPVGVVASQGRAVRRGLLAVISPTAWARPGISTSWFWWGCIMTAGSDPQPAIISSDSISHIVTWLSK